MNTYALSDCLTLSPEPFVSCKGPEQKGHSRHCISQEANTCARKSMLLDFAFMLWFLFCCSRILAFYLNESHG